MQTLFNFATKVNSLVTKIETYYSLYWKKSNYKIPLYIQRPESKIVFHDDLETLFNDIEQESKIGYIYTKNPILGTFLSNNANYIVSYRKFLNEWDLEWIDTFEDIAGNRFRIYDDGVQFYFEII